MIEVQNISKSFGSKKALDAIGFHIPAGELVGFLGRNGAGKTTLMRILCGYLRPDSGDAVIGGRRLSEDVSVIQSLIGYLPETPPLYPEMRVEEYVALAARLRNVEPRRIPAAVNKAIDDCRLTDVRRKIIATLSKGFKQRVGLAQAVVHDPAILILDEPTGGLDPVQIAQTRELIKNLEGSRTVILSTHILSEIETLVKRVLIIKDGRLAADDRPEWMMKDKGRRVRLRIRGDAEVLKRTLSAHPGAEWISSSIDNGVLSLDVRWPDSGRGYNDLLQTIINAPAQILECREHSSTLEDVFLELHA